MPGSGSISFKSFDWQEGHSISLSESSCTLLGSGRFKDFCHKIFIIFSTYQKCALFFKVNHKVSSPLTQGFNAYLADNELDNSSYWMSAGCIQ
jgi:hypothetical protein